ncbi:MAG: hypothetical protein OXC95_04935 [Dehalococcoidia bacterium]|nr:hypothetical protein [Dehalococcoidia bacterium]
MPTLSISKQAIIGETKKGGPQWPALQLDSYVSVAYVVNRIGLRIGGRISSSPSS